MSLDFCTDDADENLYDGNGISTLKTILVLVTMMTDITVIMVQLSLFKITTKMKLVVMEAVM